MRWGLMTLMVTGVIALTGCGKDGGGSDEADQAASGFGQGFSATAPLPSTGSGSGVAQQYLSGLDRIAVVVENVKDEASARKAAQVIASVSEDFTKTTAALNNMSDTEKGLIFARHASELQRVQMRVGMAVQSLATQPQHLRVISDEMQKLPKVY